MLRPPQLHAVANNTAFTEVAESYTCKLARQTEPLLMQDSKLEASKLLLLALCEAVPCEAGFGLSLSEVAEAGHLP